MRRTQVCPPEELHEEVEIAPGEEEGLGDDGAYPEPVEGSTSGVVAMESQSLLRETALATSTYTAMVSWPAASSGLMLS